MNTKLLVFLLVLVSSAVLRAEPLDQRRIAADTKWLVHVDLDAIRDSQSAKHLIGVWLQTEPARSHLVGVREAVGLDVVNDLRDITVYGRDLVPDRGVLVVHAPIDKSRLMTFLARQPNYAELKEDGRDVLTWTERRGGRKHTVFAAMQVQEGQVQEGQVQEGQVQEGQVQEGMVFSKNASDLTAALAVLDGKAASLAKVESPLRGGVPEGSVLLVRASGLSEAKLALKSPILRLSETLALTAGEDASTAFVEVRLTAASAEHVPQFRDVATGLVALAKLMRDNDEDVLKLLDAITISTEDRAVSARWSGQLMDVIKAVGNERLRNYTKD